MIRWLKQVAGLCSFGYGVFLCLMSVGINYGWLVTERRVDLFLLYTIGMLLVVLGAIALPEEKE